MTREVKLSYHRRAQAIIDQAIADWNPVAVVCAYSGGYDSLAVTHLAHTALDLHDMPLSVWTIDTNLAADDWLEYVRAVGERYGWLHTVHDNRRGFADFLESVRRAGCPFSPSGHQIAYRCLKERSFWAALKQHKEHRFDKVLFLTGIRATESTDRQDAPEVNRIGKSNMIFASPILHWTDEDLTRYRLDNNLPENPFYTTVGGSGDCQCNWGNFITLDRLRHFSPELAAGNVGLIDQISKELHGYGWDGENPDQVQMFDRDELDWGEHTTPFLCSNCSRGKRHDKAKAAEFVALQRGLW